MNLHTEEEELEKRWEHCIGIWKNTTLYRVFNDEQKRDMPYEENSLLRRVLGGNAND